MTTASLVMFEIDWRELWPEVIDHRAYLMRLRERTLTPLQATAIAATEINRFPDERFPVSLGDAEADAAEAAIWNGDLQH